MALVVNTNVASLVAQKNASDSASGLQQAMERLSSGQRINSAKDDSAGLAISNRMESLVRGFNAATRNVNDGISMIQTAESSMNEINTIMQRMRELAVQAANGANSAADRVNLNSEFNSLKDQMNQIANTTTFNGKSLLTGEFYAQNVQAGARAGEQIGVGFQDTRASAVGAYEVISDRQSFTAAALATVMVSADNPMSTGYDNGVTAETLSISVANGDRIDLSDTTGFYGVQVGIEAKDQMIDVAKRINASDAGLQASARTELQMQLAAADTTNVADVDLETETVSQATIYLQSGNGSNMISFTVEVDDQEDFASSVAASINATSTTTGITASVDDDLKTIKMVQSEGYDVRIGFESETATISLAGGEVDMDRTAFEATALYTTATEGYAVVAGQLTISGGAGIKVETEIGTSNFTETTAQLSTVAQADILSVDGATDALAVLDMAIERVSQYQADAGAVLSRLDYAASNLQSASANQAAARSRIMDTDFAQESANLAKFQILQQASTAMLAQANAVPQNVLSLLG